MGKPDSRLSKRSRAYADLSRKTFAISKKDSDATVSALRETCHISDIYDVRQLLADSNLFPHVRTMLESTLLWLEGGEGRCMSAFMRAKVDKVYNALRIVESEKPPKPSRGGPLRRPIRPKVEIAPFLNDPSLLPKSPPKAKV